MQLEKDKEIKHLISRLVVVMDRLSDTELNPQQTAIDIFENFGNSDEVQKAILKGSLGGYGIPYKLTTAVIRSWIYESRKPKKTNNDRI